MNKIKKCQDCLFCKERESKTGDSFYVCDAMNQTLLRQNVNSKLPGNCPLYNWTYSLVHTW